MVYLLEQLAKKKTTYKNELIVLTYASEAICPTVAAYVVK